MNRIFIIICFSIFVVPLYSFATDKENAKNGELQYMEKCDGRCHDTKIHTRPNRIIHTYEDLLNRVRFCDSQAKSNFSEQDVIDVSAYLNNAFYKFVKVKDNE